MKIKLIPRPFSKAERTYLKKVEDNRSRDFIQFNKLDSMVKQKIAEEGRKEEETAALAAPQYIYDWIKNN